MFYDRLKALCKAKGTTISAMLSDLNLSTGSTGNWKRGKLPGGEILIKIADYLGTSVDYLITGEFRADLTTDCQRLVNLYKSVPEFARYKVLCDFEKNVAEEIARVKALEEQ
ncbi:MAG: helix-turn-helix transcriptional regulator [Oscillospiraceae bacterium]|nr:helix-turn-helix transcriptional regulator [Oscillospiraceae bacterium]